ncbi:MAG: multicopper oxidase family protein [Vicinamibacterales bacterium]
MNDLLSRRSMLAALGATAVVVFGHVPPAYVSQSGRAPEPLDPATLTKFVDPVPSPPVLDGTRPQSVEVAEVARQVLPSTFTAGPFGGKTLVWGYDGAYPGPTIEARRGVPFTVTFTNTLRQPALLGRLTIDRTLPWADPLGCRRSGACAGEAYRGPVPVVTHLHGGEVPSAFDGHPQAWATPGHDIVGSAWVSQDYVYPNAQEAATLWYHDHAMGLTRLNVYAGLGGFYLLRDPDREPRALPSGAFERELIVQDRMFDTDGQLFYPPGPGEGPHPDWIPMFMGDTIVVNGAAWPYLDVEPRRYRLRLLNGSNARSYTLRFEGPDGGPGPTLWQIGTDGGLLDHPLPLTEIRLSPGERADVIVDFTAVAGRSLFLKNLDDTPAWSGATAGIGDVLKVNVTLPVSGEDRSLAPAATTALRPSNGIVPLSSTTTPTSVIRRMTLEKGEQGYLLNGTPFHGAVTELPRVGATELWVFDNRTGDVHPIHLHLVQFQVLSGAGFAGGRWGSGGSTGGTLAWKDTVRVDPWAKVSIVVRLAPQDVPASGAAAGVNRFSFDPSAPPGTMDAFGYPGGPGYVWHCHILEHEDNDMMRPYRVQP